MVNAMPTEMKELGRRMPKRGEWTKKLNKEKLLMLKDANTFHNLIQHRHAERRKKWKVYLTGS